MTRYQWGLRTTRQYLDDEGNPDGPEDIEERQVTGESHARMQVEETRRAMAKGRHPKAWKIVRIVALRRPVGEWEEVE